MTSKARDAINAVIDCAFDGKLKITETAFEKVLDASAEPVRNCDLYTNRHDAWWAFRKEREDLWWEDLHLEFPDWLFAEAKGEQANE